MARPTRLQVEIRRIQRYLSEMHEQIAAFDAAAQLGVPLRRTPQTINDIHNKTHVLMSGLASLASIIDGESQSQQVPANETTAVQALAQYMSAASGDPVEDCIDTALSHVRSAVPPGSERTSSRSRRRPSDEMFADLDELFGGDFGSLADVIESIRRNHGRPPSPVDDLFRDIEREGRREQRSGEHGSAPSSDSSHGAPPRSRNPFSGLLSGWRAFRTRRSDDAKAKSKRSDVGINLNDLPPEVREDMVRSVREATGLSQADAERLLATGHLHMSPDSITDIPSMGDLLRMFGADSGSMFKSGPGVVLFTTSLRPGDPSPSSRQRATDGTPPTGPDETVPNETDPEETDEEETDEEETHKEDEIEEEPNGQGSGIRIEELDLRDVSQSVRDTVADILTGTNGTPPDVARRMVDTGSGYPTGGDQTDPESASVPGDSMAGEETDGGSKPVDLGSVVEGIDQVRTARGDSSLGDIVDSVTKSDEPNSETPDTTPTDKSK